MAKGIKVSNKEIETAKSKIVKKLVKEEAIQLAEQSLAEEIKQSKVRPAVVEEVKELMSGKYWTYYFSKKELKDIIETFVDVAIKLDAVVQTSDEAVNIDWNIAPRPETDQIDYWEGIPQIFIERTNTTDKSLYNALLLIAKLASNDDLCILQDWNDDDKIAWYAVAQDAIRLTKGKKTKDINGVVIPAISSGWMPSDSDPKKWAKELKGYANTLISASKL